MIKKICEYVYLKHGIITNDHINQLEPNEIQFVCNQINSFRNTDEDRLPLIDLNQLAFLVNKLSEA